MSALSYLPVQLTVAVLFALPANVMSEEINDTDEINYEARLEIAMAGLAEEMAVIRATRDPDERQRLMDTHLNNMRETLILMRGMGGEAMQMLMAEHLAASEQEAPKGKRPIHVHKWPTEISASTSGGLPPLADLELRLDMMQVVLESLVEQCAAP
jgi:uncharacterized protein YicC (UPF0701 family)